MRKPTAEEIHEQTRVLRSDPQRYVEIMTDLINDDPHNPHHYFGRHSGWDHLGQPEKALADLDRAIALGEHVVHYEARGNILSQLGRHREALQDFATGEALDPALWQEMWGPLYEANCHARLGNEKAALAACERLSKDHWSPGLCGAPEGNKAEVITEICHRAASANRGM